MKVDMLQGTKLDWYVKDTHRLKESTLKRYFPQFPRMEEIIFILSYACSKNIKVYQMDMESSFMNGELEEEVYIKTTRRISEIRQRNQGIFISQTKYIIEMLKRFRMEYCKQLPLLCKPVAS
jgi:hypothetical protein